MNTIAEFTIIGRVGEIKQVGSTLRVSLASSFSRRDGIVTALRACGVLGGLVAARG